MEKINVDVLRRAFSKIIDKLNYEKIEEIKFDYDLYRIIPTDKWKIDFSGKDFSETGSLVDDLKAIEQLVTDEDHICTYVDFDRVASLLRAISEERNPVSD